MHVPEGLRYTESHEWVRLADDGTVEVGVTDFAQDTLGDIVFVDLPDVGVTFAAGDPFGEVESTKSVADVYAPVAGTVVAVNEALEGTPELVNRDPYGDGWLIVLRPTGARTAVDDLLDAAAYRALTEG